MKLTIEEMRTNAAAAIAPQPATTPERQPWLHRLLDWIAAEHRKWEIRTARNTIQREREYLDGLPAALREAIEWEEDRHTGRLAQIEHEARLNEIEARAALEKAQATLRKYGVTK